MIIDFRNRVELLEHAESPFGFFDSLATSEFGSRRFPKVIALDGHASAQAVV